jgi:3-deoxy-7-phosphoheptulonate synthase
MVIVMAAAAGDADLAEVVRHVESAGGSAFVSRGVTRTIVGVVGTEEVLETLDVALLPGVDEVVRITAPYKLVSSENTPKRSTVSVGGVPIGPDTFTLIAGPCAVESAEQTLAAAQQARRAGATLLRGGAYKPRTSPYAFQGLGVDGLRILAQVSKETGLPVVTEIMDPADVDVVAEHADMFQIGTRNMQNFPLLQAVGAAGKPVMLKRGLTATYEEWLMAAEYIAQRGNLDIVLCERGIRGFEPTIRNMLDVSAIPMVHAHSHLPVIVDPSHAAGRRDLVLPLARAGMAAAVRRRPGAVRGPARRADGRGGHDPPAARPPVRRHRGARPPQPLTPAGREPSPRPGPGRRRGAPGWVACPRGAASVRRPGPGRPAPRAPAGRAAGRRAGGRARPAARRGDRRGRGRRRAGRAAGRVRGAQAAAAGPP